MIVEEGKLACASLPPWWDNFQDVIVLVQEGKWNDDVRDVFVLLQEGNPKLK